jgi:hypothetical protein
MIRFLFATLFYRLGNGLLFLSIAWNLLRGSDNGAMSLAISSVAGFLPAVLIAPFAKRLLGRVDSLKLTVGGIALLLALSLIFVPFLKLPAAVLLINFALLLVFFLLEGAWDTLLATVAVQLSPARADALNARQSAATQAGLMLGGLPLGMLMRAGGPALSFCVSALMYAVAIALLLALPLLAKPRPAVEDRASAPIFESQPTLSERQSNQAVPWHTLLMLAMVWPCLTLVNMAMPLLANSYGKGTVEHAALLDAMIGFGMAFAGLSYGVFGRLSTRHRQWVIVTCAAFVPLPFLLLQVVGYLLFPLAVSYFLCGVGFGLFRVSARKQLIATQSTQRVGQIVFSCNAYGFPVLMIGAFLYAITWANGPAVPLVAFVIFAFAGSAMMLGERTTKWRNGSSPTQSEIRPVAPTE